MLQNTEKYERYHEKSPSVLGPDVAEHRKVGKVPGKMNTSSCAGCCRTSKSTKISRKNEHQFSGRMLLNTEKYERYHEKSPSVLGPDVAEHRKVRKVPGKMNISSCAGCCRTPKTTKITRKNEHQFSSRMLQNTESTKGTTKNHHQFSGRMLQSTEKYEK